MLSRAYVGLNMVVGFVAGGGGVVGGGGHRTMRRNLFHLNSCTNVNNYLFRLGAGITDEITIFECIQKMK